MRSREKLNRPSLNISLALSLFTSCYNQLRPWRPQLILIDIPGLVGLETRGTTTRDLELVTEITKYYIKQERTICLAAVSAATDYATQSILRKVRKLDKRGDRTLSVITKSDIPANRSGLQKGYIELTQNQDIFFELGWHIVKNRTWEEKDASLAERKASETSIFRSTNWKCLPSESVGIDALRISLLLFEHVKKELPML